MNRIFIEAVEEDRALLPRDEVHHLVTVRRAREGDTFMGLDGFGNIYLCRLQKEQGQWFGRILEKREGEAESPFRVILGHALIKKDKFEWVLQKATELGVSEIVPLMTRRTEIRLDATRQEKKLKRWDKVLAEAVKQSRRAELPKLADPIPLERFLPDLQVPLRIVLDEEKGQSLKEVLAQNREAESCVVLVGPEGGWEEQDRQLLQQHEVIFVHLGPRILRSETAPLVVLSILQYELGDLG